jgi:hypothetical protein
VKARLGKLGSPYRVSARYDCTGGRFVAGLSDGRGGIEFWPAWSHDGRVYSTSLQNGVENIWSE